MARAFAGAGGIEALTFDKLERLTRLPHGWYNESKLTVLSSKELKNEANEAKGGSLP